MIAHLVTLLLAVALCTALGASAFIAMAAVWWIITGRAGLRRRSDSADEFQRRQEWQP
jgi:NhaP-type Na+/H+ or K+/H+ antiporter